MEKSLDFERKLKKLLKSQIDAESRAGLDFLPPEGRYTWLNAMCLSLATKAVKGDISAIKYINEICLKESGEDEKSGMSITVKVID